MSTQSGGDGYGKFRKNCQSGGASGWAKHCGNTDDHKLSNRTERRRIKDQLTEDDGVSRLKSKPKSAKKPTRRHLMDKLIHIDGKIAQRKRDIEQHKKERPDCPGCMSYCSDKWLSTYYNDGRKKILAEFEKYGYKKP